MEYRFAKKHSIGVDFVHFRWRYEYDIYIDNYETGYGPDAFSRRRYMLFDYRYYPFATMMQKRSFDPYVSTFIKVGERKVWTSEPYTFFYDNDLSNVRKHRAEYIDYGFALGFRHDFGDMDRVGVDMNLGLVYRESRIRYEESYDHPSDSFSERFSGSYSNWKPHMRLNIYVKILNLK